MKTTGEFYEHRGLIAFTGAFLTALALSACDNEKMSDPQTKYENLPVNQTEIALQKKEPLTVGEPSAALALRQAMNTDTTDSIQPALFDKLRALARWYHERGKLQLVKNAVESTDLLKPGVVLFFGKNGFTYEDFSVDDLLVPQKGIDHLGVVVKVHRNESGQVLHYELFHGHGRKGKTPASITEWHKRTPSRAGYPPLGNGRQQWVAIARL